MPKPYFSFKLDPQRRARPARSRGRSSRSGSTRPRVEGVHLRFGAVARGGLRWSDRREDFRTEVLGLVKAQAVKNAVIVPVGAKGGFVVKQLPDPASTARPGWPRAIALLPHVHLALLDITDNLVDGERRAAADVVRHDGDDPYLVVAADKGTATFSDIANERRGRLRLLARRRLRLRRVGGLRPQGDGHHRPRRVGVGEAALPRARASTRRQQDFTVVGVGDMSGDVFGNGMLLSEHIRLVAAFDHRHVFLDPTPDAAPVVRRAPAAVRPAALVVGRLRHVAACQPGGGVYPRTAKSIPITPEVRAALGLAAGVAVLTPAELMQAMLRAPVDLFWNGGIGTYVKAAERDATPTSATRPTTRSASTAPTCAAGSSVRAATSASPSSAGSRRRSAGVRHQHRRHRQLRRRRHLRPRGQHQDPARPGRPGRRPHRRSSATSCWRR